VANREEGAIIRWVSLGHYEKALDISFEASRFEISRAHIRKLHLCTSSPLAREYLNRAKSALFEETASRRANRLLAIGETQNALIVLQQTLNENSNAHEYHMVGYVLLQLNRCNEAAFYMQKAFALAPTPFNAIWLGQTFEQMNLRSEALEKYLHAIAERGNETEFRLAGNLSYHMGDLRGALAYLLRAVEAGCTDDETLERIRTIRQRLRIAQLRVAIRKFFHLS